MLDNSLIPKIVENAFLKGVTSSYQLTFDNQIITHSVYSVSGEEQLDKPWRYEVVFTTAKLIDPQTLLRESVALTFTPNISIKETIKTLSALTEPATPRTQYGVVTRFKHLSQSKEEHKYSITIEPRLSLLSHNKRSAIYQHQSIVAVVEQILREHGFTGVDYRLELQENYPTKEFIVQWQESDLAFIQRLLADSGIWLRFESHSKHNKEIVILCDNNESAEQIKVPIPYNPPSSLLDGGTFSVWSLGVESRIISGAVLAKDYNYRAANKDLISQSAITSSQTNNNSTVYGVDYLYGQDFKEASNEVDEGEWLANIRAQRHETTQYIITGKSNDYRLAIGQHVTIKGSPLSESDLLITTVTGSGDRTNSYELEFTAIAYNINKPYRPDLLPVPIIHTTIPAKVTSPDNDTYGYIDTEGRYRVKFLFDLTDWKAGEESVWLRQAKPYSGDKYGFHFPLIDGTEVAVAFTHGHPDRPYIAHAMHNSTHQDLVTTQNKHQNILRTAADNLLEMDDLRGKEHIALATEYGKTQLNIGHLVHHSGTKNDPRGEGFELRSDDWGAIRAGKGLYLSTDGRTDAQGGQLDQQEAIALLEQALQIAKGLAGASRSTGSELTDIQTQESQLLDSYMDLQKPAILVNAKAGFALTSPKNIQLSSADNLTFTSVKSIDGSSQQDIRFATTKKLSLLAVEGDVNFIANQGKLNIQAQNNEMEIVSQQNLDLLSSDGVINIAAGQGIKIMSGEAYILIQDGKIEFGAPKSIEHKGSAFPFSGPSTMGYTLPGFTKASGNFNVSFNFADDDGHVFANTPFIATMPNGKTLKGITDSDGNTPKFFTDSKEDISVQLITQERAVIENLPENGLIGESSEETKEQYNIRFYCVDDRGNPYSEKEYSAYMSDGTIKKGKTDNEGYTQVFYSDEPEEISIHLHEQQLSLDA